MRKIVFITIPNYAKSSGSQPASCALFESDELNKYVEDGWTISDVKTITPPEAKTRALIQVLLDK